MNFLDLEEITEIHDLQISKYGGLSGIRDYKILESSLMNPFASFDNQDLYPGIIQKAARLGYNICVNHPFVDGNKRTRALVLENCQHNLN